MLQNNLLLKSLSALMLASGGLQALGQAPPSVKQDAKNASCSNIVALAGNVNLDCSSLTPAQQKLIESIPALLHKILANQLDPNAVMEKLNEIHKDILHIQNRQGWPELTEEQIRTLKNKLSEFPSQKLMIIVTNPDTNKSVLAGQLEEAVQSAKWEVKQSSNMWSGPPVTGIYIAAKGNTLAALTLLNALGEIFGKSVVAAGISDKLTDEDIAINIYDSPRPSTRN